VVPLFAGSGIRIKILEAMAHGLAVAATPAAVAGLPLQHNRQIMIADTPEAFRKATEKLLTDEEHRLTLSRNATHLLKENFDRESLIQKLEKFYTSP